MDPEQRAEVGDVEAVRPRRSGRWWKPVALIGAVILLFVIAKALRLDEKLGDLKAWITSLGPWGPIVFVLIYVAATVAAVPGSALTVIAGGVFGSVRGTISVSVGSTLGAALCFLIARYIARDAVAQSLSASEKFQRLDELTERRGWIIVAVTRLVPLFPFNLLNYGFGLTRVRFWTYVIFSWMCMLPGTILYVVGADAVVTGIREGRIPWLLIGVVVAVLGMLSLVVRYARQSLRSDETPELEPSPESQEDSEQ